MRGLTRRRPSPAMAVAFVALVAALTGSAVALPGKNKVDSGDIKNNTIGSGDLKNNSVKSKDVRNGAVTGTDVKNDALTGDDVNESALGQVPSAATAGLATAAGLADRANSAAKVDQLKTVGSYKLVTSSASNDDPNVARANATQVPLFSIGPISVYGKCYTEADNSETTAEAFISTTLAGSISSASNGYNLEGDPDYLDPGGDETFRTLKNVTAADNEGRAETYDNDFGAAAPDGTAVSGSVAVAAKRGSPPEGNGIYGPGNVCIFWGEMVG